MAHCPYCHDWYDEDNDTQPGCPGCGYPYTYEDGDGDLLLPDDGLLRELEEEMAAWEQEAPEDDNPF